MPTFRVRLVLDDGTEHSALITADDPGAACQKLGNRVRVQRGLRIGEDNLGVVDAGAELLVGRG